MDVKQLEKYISILRYKINTLLESKDYCLSDLAVQKVAKLFDELVCEYYILSFKKEMDTLIEEENYDLSDEKIIRLSQTLDELICEHHHLQKSNLTNRSLDKHIDSEDIDFCSE